MSKKRPRSERDVGLPDWADDVTPADEVMRKFYAPTGAFKPGPIPVPQPIADTTPRSAPLDERARAEPSPENTGVESTYDSPQAPASDVVIERREIEPTLDSQISLLSDLSETEEKLVTSLPAHTHEINPTGVHNVVDERGSDFRQTPPSAAEAIGQAQTFSFEEFARKWRRYLYPGQMAVMRTLYEMTLSRGTTECFTQYSQIALATKMTRRNCINVMNSLVERGFVERLEVRNDAAGKGIRLRVHPDPLP
jgi:hypothetical protein